MIELPNVTSLYVLLAFGTVYRSAGELAVGQVDAVLLGCAAQQSQGVVAPGEVASYPFELVGPATPGIYRVYFRPVLDGITWMEDQGVFWLVDRR